MIYIPFDKHTSLGGPSTFMQNLQADLDREQYPYHEEYKKGDSIFFPIRFDFGVLKKIKKHGGAIIQRLDGVYYPSHHGSAYKKRNQRIQEVYLDYADTVVFQSDYCRLQCQEMLGKRDSDKDVTICNGVDPEIFFPADAAPLVGDCIEFITTGNFRRRLMLEPILNALESLKPRCAFRLHIVGPVKEELTDLVASRNYVVLHGNQTLHEVGQQLRRCHVYLFSNLNPPCPNSVLEAAATGLPVVSFDGGSLPELLPFSTELLAPVSSDLIQLEEDLRPERLSEKIELVINDLPKFETLARTHAGDFPFSKCGEKYRELFDSV